MITGDILAQSLNLVKHYETAKSDRVLSVFDFDLEIDPEPDPEPKLCHRDRHSGCIRSPMAI